MFTDGSDTVELTPKKVLTARDIEAALVAARPEFADHKGVRQLFGFTRTHAYQLAKEGKIRSVCIRRPGAIRGRRLFDCASIRAFLNKCGEDGKRKTETCCFH